jgi:hypothetical protein
MKRLVYFLALLSVLMFACSIPTTATPPAGTSAPVASDTPPDTEVPPATEPPITTEPPTATEPPVAQTNVTCNELSLYLDPALASGFNCETVAASTEGMEMYPQYTKLTLQGYALSDKFFEPEISVYPIQDYTNLLPENVPTRVTELQALISGGATGDSALPFLPFFPAAQMFHAQYQVLPFVSGGGIRYMTLYAQYFAPVNNHDVFYTYQGLTTDGLYWVSAILPINNPILPANADNPPGGVTWEQFSNDYATYKADITNQLNSQPSGSFTPTLEALDALASSITIQP